MQMNSNSISMLNSYKTPLPKVTNLDINKELSLFRQNNAHYFPKITFKENSDNEDESQSENFPTKFSSISPSLVMNPSIFINPDFKLLLAKNIETPLCKSKYFSFKILLKPMGSQIYPPNEKVELEVMVFSMDDILITKNMRGKDILRGNNIQNMNFFTLENMHVAYFRIQITEVSSHFVGKSVKLKIQAKKSEFMRQKGWKVQSITVPNLVVKAKDKKEKKIC